jgi:hypothetical protein
MIQEGQYQARSFGEAQLGETPNGVRYFGLLLEVTKGPFAGVRVGYRGWVNTIDNRKRTVEAFRNAGWRGAKWGDWTGLGKSDCTIQVVHEAGEGEYEGRTFARVSFVNPLLASAVRKPLPRTEIDRLNAEFGGELVDGETGEVIA